MSRFDNYFNTAGLPTLQHYEGEEIIYEFAAGSSSTITAVVVREEQIAVSDMAEERREEIRVIVEKSDVPDPKVKDKITLSGESDQYDFEEIEESTANNWRLRFVRLSLINVGRYRGR